MKVFVDANILISVINKEYPLFTYTSRILSLANSASFQIYTSPVCLAIAFYFAEKKFRTVKAKDKISLMCRYVEVASTTKWSVEKTLQNKKVLDFEDGLEYYSAEESKCTCIVTEDINDFHFAEMEVMKSEQFFDKYMQRK